MLFLAIRDGRFAVYGSNRDKPQATFDPTVAGAVECHNYLREENKKGGGIQMSSSLNHPDEFPGFEPHAIDIACGEFEDAIAAGVIAFDSDPDDLTQEGSE